LEWGLPMSGSKRPNKVRDFGLYLLIALGIAVFGVLYGVHAARTGGNGQLPLRWIGFAAQTALTFGYPVVGLRPLWRRRWLWVTTGLLLVLHTLIFVAVLQRVHDWPLIYFVPIGYVEYIGILTVIDRLAYRSESK